MVCVCSLFASYCCSSTSGGGSGLLSFDFYRGSCPAAEMIVQNTVRSASSQDPTIPGKLLRLLFHDCFVEVRHSLCLETFLRAFSTETAFHQFGCKKWSVYSITSKLGLAEPYLGRGGFLVSFFNFCLVKMSVAPSTFSLN